MITVGVLDPHQISREVVNNHLSDQEELTFKVTFTGDKKDLSKVHKICFPDVFLVEIDNYGPSIVREILKICPETNVIILSNNRQLESVYECFRNGALGYLDKETCLFMLPKAIEITFKGGSFISPGISRLLIGKHQRMNYQEDSLTAREMQVAQGILDGLSYKLIAARYDIALDTVRVYIKRIYRKLNINSKGELMARYVNWSTSLVA